MIYDIDMNRKREIIQTGKILFEKLELAQKDKTAIADYIDFFDTRCVPLAIKCLPKKEKKQYAGKQHDLMAGLNSLKNKVGSDERKMYKYMVICAHKFGNFVRQAFFGPIVVSNGPLQELIEAEKASTITSLVYSANEEKYKRKYFIDEQSEQ